MKITNQRQLRSTFWKAHPQLEAHALKWGIKTAPHNRHNEETRFAFVCFADDLARQGIISEALANRATL